MVTVGYGGGDGGGGAAYDDQWIKDWMATATTSRDELSEANLHRFNENTAQSTQIGDLTTRSDEATRRLDELGTWNQHRADEIAGLTGDLSGLRGDLSDLEGLVNTPTAVGDVTGLDDIIQNLQTQYSNVSGDVSGLDTRMTQNLDALGSTLRDEFGANIQALDLPSVRAAIEASQGDIGSLTEQFSGLTSELDTLGRDLRAEYGDDILDLSDTFEDRLSGVQSELGSEIQNVFGYTDQLRSGLEGLTSNLGTTSQQLGTLRDSFSDYKTQAESNLSDVRSAFESEVGDVRGQLTSGLSDLSGQSASARETLASDLRGEAETALGDVYKTREEAIASLTGDFGQQLQSQEADLSARIAQQDTAFDEKLGKLQATMNYRMLGDSAGGVKMRRSKAYKSGAVSTGTGQLSRTMKLKTLNL